MSIYSPRLPHVVSRADLVALLVPTYMEARSVDGDEAADRLGQALAARGVAEDLYRSLSAGLEEAQGPRTTVDGLVDRLSAGIQARRGRTKPAPDSPGLSAVLIRLDLEIGVAPEQMRATLATPRGRDMLEQGLAALGKHLVRELLKK